MSYVETMNSRHLGRHGDPLPADPGHPLPVSRRWRRWPATPVLVIVGDKDMITPVTHSEEIVRRLPHAEFVKIPDSGHVVMLEHADEVNAALRATSWSH